MRISIQLDESRPQKLQYLRDATQLATSEILERAIDANFEQLRLSRPADTLRRVGFVGCSEADQGLSLLAKAEWTELLRSKHEHR